jgi:DNA-binding XRE family transcriptional regulator
MVPGFLQVRDITLRRLCFARLRLFRPSRLCFIFTQTIHQRVGMNPAQCRAARRLLDWTAADLARAAGVSVFTVRDFEAGKVAVGTRRAPTLMARALQGAGILFGSDDGGEDSVHLA